MRSERRSRDCAVLRTSRRSWSRCTRPRSGGAAPRGSCPVRLPRTVSTVWVKARAMVSVHDLAGDAAELVAARRRGLPFAFRDVDAISGVLFRAGSAHLRAPAAWFVPEGFDAVDEAHVRAYLRSSAVPGALSLDDSLRALSVWFGEFDSVGAAEPGLVFHVRVLELCHAAAASHGAGAPTGMFCSCPYPVVLPNGNLDLLLVLLWRVCVQTLSALGVLLDLRTPIIDPVDHRTRIATLLRRLIVSLRFLPTCLRAGSLFRLTRSMSHRSACTTPKLSSRVTWPRSHLRSFRRTGALRPRMQITRRVTPCTVPRWSTVRRRCRCGRSPTRS